MAWLGKVSLGGFPDLAGTVAKLSESVKNIEKNFDTALGLEEKPDDAGEGGQASGIWSSASDRKALFDPVMTFMGQKGDDDTVGEQGNVESSEQPSFAEEHEVISAEGVPVSTMEKTASSEDNTYSENKGKDSGNFHVTENSLTNPGEPDRDITECESKISNTETELPTESSQASNSVDFFQHKEGADTESSESQPERFISASLDVVEEIQNNISSVTDEIHHASDSKGSQHKIETEIEVLNDKGSPVNTDVLDCRQASNEEVSSGTIHVAPLGHGNTSELFTQQISSSHISEQEHVETSGFASHDSNESSEPTEAGLPGKYIVTAIKEQPLKTTLNSSDGAGSAAEIEKLRSEIRSMEASMLGAARQAQAKADEIANLMNENEYLRSVIEDLKKKTAEAEIQTLRDEYHQRVSSLERRVYALTKERDTLRREQSKKSDAAALLKEKDEIITQVMAEGEELSKKQAAQESTIRKLRAQIREVEEEKQRLNSKLQVEETKVESITRDKAETEKLLQETIERNQVELAAQKEFYTNALNASKEAEALAEARVNNEARAELESCLRESGERESMLVQTLEELRQTLSRTEQQAVFREDMLQRDIEDLQKRYQASELRYNELITQVPESTRPLLRQIEAMQETSIRRAKSWAGIERALNSRLQEAEAKTAGAEERERAMNERLSQNLSRITVLETQISCLRTEQTQLSRSLEKERQRASENRQEYLAAIEEAATQEGRAKQIEFEINELRNKFKCELQAEASRRELLEKELEKERDARLELEKTVCESPAVTANHYSENGSLPFRKLSSARSLSSMEESVFLQASLDSSQSDVSERRIPGEKTMSSYFLKSMTPSAFEAALRQRDGVLASYVSRLASLESIRHSLSEELVKMTAQCEKLRAEVAVLPGLQAELEALRRRHSSALELMGERDEELEELRADIIDLKEMYREQVDLLVNRVQTLSSSADASAS